MTDYQIFCLTILALAALRIMIMIDAATEIALSLGNRSAAANALRTSLALKCIRQLLLYIQDVESAFRRLAS